MQYIQTAEQAEQNAAVQMRALGYSDAQVTGRGADGGIDIRATGAVAQVKWQGAQVGRPELQRLCGARGTMSAPQMFFFTASSYSTKAVEYAAEVQMALFTYDPTGFLTPANAIAVQILIYKEGDPVQAEARYRKAADTGDTSAMVSLGHLLERQGDPVQAEHWYRKAADTGNTDAMFRLGRLFYEDDPVQAEHWHRKAADTGHTGAMVNLGVLLEWQGDAVGAEAWYRKAADAGDEAAMFNLRGLLERQGDAVQTEPWYGKAADTGDTDAL
ncbi:hypothetical protein C5E45_23700 [Nocardia nova]|uniref:Restriction endonuclease type IV Mrr domain-containing protein n=1 Tax=Nocardia nova TaxID=37330 RepID=A0A2S6AKR5_9NOCA|nr:restriction endonuclease [Nocardia nova]PPJ35818.1 hypothetical protein C5E45_23700 [Nocardia nova]